MLKEQDILFSELAHCVVHWYKAHGRVLPWRKTKDPYKIWISEIMLQQTQVETVKPYYERFVEVLPTVHDLAMADTEKVYKLWEGLGYYRRAAHLQEAAQTVVNDYGGVFPNTYEDLLKLKGVGMYPASAIASIAYGMPKGVIDGNTLRILARVGNYENNIALQKTKNAFSKIMDDIIVHADPSDFNQGMMDLGAMICTPKKPHCDLCPIAGLCLGRAEKTAERLPVNIKKVKKSVEVYMTPVIVSPKGIFVTKNKGGMLEHLYGLVQYPCELPSEFEKQFYENYGVRIRLIAYLQDVRHIFTHREWHMRVYVAETVGDTDFSETDNLFLWDEDAGFRSLEEIKKLPIATAHQKVLKAYLKGVDG